MAASPQFDLWSLGVLAFRSLARRPLFNSDDRDNMRDDDELRRLARWDARSVADAVRAVTREMREHSGVSARDQLAAAEMIAWLLQRDPAQRPNVFEIRNSLDTTPVAEF